MKTFKIFILMVSIFSIFSSCNKPRKVENRYLTAIAPKSYVDITDFGNNDVLLLDNLKNGLESIFSIDNIQDITIQPNSQTIQDFTPVESLENRLRVIKEDTQEPDCNWKNFRITESPKAIKFKSYRGAEAVFSVVENVNNTGRIVTRKIKRMVIFTENDLWNFVLAPSDLENYEDEMKIFNQILESIEIKK
ncbi:hypothetical protein LZQ00_03020 [Sphingobacterium sp. SRCM116780]|uniref:hypothetical protein n=1 Tax=Sphingobacterium sp. SRCM116780 TaxID=2907623 RepID=UPI001F32D204|nr:hypothetical protein [Sphingobacterium sp. SRCM116780]UIR56796.1 hypothetical protein LZQ00_03020 [Sphingobacterium sp. SRCM116780]